MARVPGIVKGWLGPVVCRLGESPIGSSVAIRSLMAGHLTTPPAMHEVITTTAKTITVIASPIALITAATTAIELASTYGRNGEASRVCRGDAVAGSKGFGMASMPWLVIKLISKACLPRMAI
ncbi:2-methoxy-6-polyprenyl-1,4-benzoquinol methylase [Fusarium oxysporum f. sp. albedinis]|nr:2-methoxy-6-polyprenyl-1,4-benzoquinol methylase [Fusarium oxysporum f. sp. albedinis]